MGIHEHNARPRPERTSAAVDRAREQVRQLVQDLDGDSAKPRTSRCAAEFDQYLLFGVTP